MRALKKSFAVVLSLLIGAFALAGCAQETPEPTAKEIANAVSELKKRGFDSPVYSGMLNDLPTYAVGLGTCRLTMVDNGASFDWLQRGSENSHPGNYRWVKGDEKVNADWLKANPSFESFYDLTPCF